MTRLLKVINRRKYEFIHWDLHFGHENVIKHDNRPFSNIDEMDRALIYNLNQKVGKNDKVYIDGDFIYKGSREPEWYLEQLNGKKYFIVGNHDRAILNSERALSYFEEVDKIMHVTDGKNQICICHFPIAEWNGFFRNHFHIYGHIHNNTNDVYYFMKKYDRALNCGCMINNYMPVTLEELIRNNEIFKQSH